MIHYGRRELRIKSAKEDAVFHLKYQTLRPTQRLYVLTAGCADTRNLTPENIKTRPLRMMRSDLMTQGLTYMLLRKPDAQSPVAFRLIACFSTLYKCLISITSDKVYAHCKANNMLTEEQKGCCHKSRGCKDLVTIASVCREAGTKTSTQPAHRIH